jgi:hypothetical protein
VRRTALKRQHANGTRMPNVAWQRLWATLETHVQRYAGRRGVAPISVSIVVNVKELGRHLVVEVHLGLQLDCNRLDATGRGDGKGRRRDGCGDERTRKHTAAHRARQRARNGATTAPRRRMPKRRCARKVERAFLPERWPILVAVKFTAPTKQSSPRSLSRETSDQRTLRWVMDRPSLPLPLLQQARTAHAQVVSQSDNIEYYKIRYDQMR